MNYSNYINSINNQIRAFNQQARVSVVGEEQFNFYNLIGGKIKQLMQEMEATSLMIKQVDDNIHSLKIRTLKKAENIITSIDSKLSEINKNNCGSVATKYNLFRHSKKTNRKMHK